MNIFKFNNGIIISLQNVIYVLNVRIIDILILNIIVILFISI